MAHDWVRCKALATVLVNASRDFDTEPGTITRANLYDAFDHVAQAMLDMGIPVAAIVTVVPGTADGVESWARGVGEREAAARRRHLVLVPDRGIPTALRNSDPGHITDDPAS
jgi:hypothetical protein